MCPVSFFRGNKKTGGKHKTHLKGILLLQNGWDDITILKNQDELEGNSSYTHSPPLSLAIESVASTLRASPDMGELQMSTYRPGKTSLLNTHMILKHHFYKVQF